jgi:DNA repair ATPase RecN
VSSSLTRHCTTNVKSIVVGDTKSLLHEAKSSVCDPSRATTDAARHAAGSESLTELVAEARRKVAEARAARALRQQERERLRKEQQRLCKVEEAREALRKAVAVMEDSAGSVEAVEEVMRAAAKHEARSESLAALVAVVLIEQARAAESERTRVAAEEAAAAAVNGCGWREW